MNIRTIVIDDQEELRHLTVKALQKISSVDVIYSTCDPKDFLKSVFKEKPDLLVMDIDMPVINGIELAQEIRQTLPDIDIIYITAHDEYLRDAISVYATDFISKPINQDRLNTTIERLSRQYNIKGSSFEIRSNKSVILINLNELIFVEAQNKKVNIYTSKGSYEADHSLKEILEIIDSDRVYKCSRSFLVNLLKVTSVVPFNRTSLEIKFSEISETALLSKKQYPEFRALIKDL